MLYFIKKIFKSAFNRIKLPFSILKTNILSSKSILPFESNLKSASDNGKYPELALKAATDPNIFSIFRRHHKYTEILEHVTRNQGDEYLKIIREKYNFKDEDIFQIISPLMQLGTPKLLKLKSFSKKISTTGLRYLKVALEIKELFGTDIGNFVEIGCGYGGQAIILDQLLKVNSYTFYDLWQVNLLIKRFIELSSFNSKYSICTIKEDTFNKRNEWDLCISNYAFSELPKKLQSLYIDNVLINSKSGYMIMNSGIEGNYGNIKNFSQKELLKLFQSSKISKEIPLTFKDNYLFTWGTK